MLLGGSLDGRIYGGENDRRGDGVTATGKA